MKYIERETALPKAIAERVRVLRLGPVIHSWRRIAEIICDEYPEQAVADGWESASAAHGNQLYGIDLCREAAEVLNEHVSDWEDEIERRLA